jgi:signal transduction histidine kinase/tetratricopeptide (TPR) repeat protein
MCQPAEIGSLRAKIKSEELHAGYQKDTTYISDIATLAHLYYALDADSLFFYARKALDLSQKIKYDRGVAESLRQLGNGYMLTGDFAQTLSYYQQSLSIAEKLKDKHLICLSLSNIGLNYGNMGKIDEALDYSLKAYALALELGDKLRQSGELSNQAEIYFAKKDYAKALDYARRATQMANELKNDYYAAFLNNSLATMLFKLGQYDKALAYFQQSLDYYSKTNDQLGVTNTDLLIAKVYLAYKNYTLAGRYALESLHLAEIKGGRKDVADAAQTLADIYETAGDYKNAVQYLKMAKNIKDTLFSDETQKKLFELQAKYKYEKEENDLKDKQAEKDLQNVHALESKKQQIVIAALIIFTLGVIIIALYQSRADKLKINRVLREKNNEIFRQKEEIEKQAEQLRIGNAQKDKLFSVIAHDLRSPFVSLQSLMTLFKDDALPLDEVKEIIVKLNVNVDHTVDLVTNLLQWASSQMNGITVSPVSFSVKNLIAEALGGVQKPAADKGIVLVDSTGMDMYIFADKDMIQLVVRNLLSNAVKFCTQGDTISVTTQKTMDAITVCIADTGAGITGEVLQKINNGESITTFGTSKEKGTGLGLLLCKDFIARNNGAFRIESEEGKGSSFYFTLKSAE